MDVWIFFQECSGRETSHERLEQAVRRYAALTGAACADELHLEMNHSGKPRYRELEAVHFSLSHSGKYWACAVSGHEIGLDLQEERAVKNPDALAHRFFHLEEAEWLAAHHTEFCRLWTYKESYVKYTGRGIAGGMNHVSVLGTMHGGMLQADGKTLVQREIALVEGYHMVVTMQEADEVHIYGDPSCERSGVRD